MTDTHNLPAAGRRLRFPDGAECTVQSVGKPLASGRFRGMHVVICLWSTGRQGSFIAETVIYKEDTDTFAQLVDRAVERAKRQAAPYTPSTAQYDAVLETVCRLLDTCDDPASFIKATHRGAGTLDARVVELFKRCRQ